jgi:Flp pilus assembly protein CpaB
VASLVPEGLRAFAVPTSLPPEAIAAGDHVDILATYGSGQPYTETVVEDVEVLLVMGGRSPPSEGLGLDAGAAGVGPGLTLVVLVAPAQQEELAFARAFADLAVTIAPVGE